MTSPTLNLEPISRLSRDLAKAAVSLSVPEARVLVDYYYTWQEHRIAATNQERALKTSNEPHEVITYLATQTDVLENQIKRALDSWTDSFPLGRWCKSIYGIGPVIAAGLAAHIDIEQAPTVGHILRFGGLDPTIEWIGKDGAHQVVSSAFKVEQTGAKAILWIAHATNRRVSDLMEIGGIAKVTAEKAFETMNALVPDKAAQMMEIFERYPLHVDNAIRHACQEFQLDEGMVYDLLYPDVRPDRKTIQAFLAKRPWNGDLKNLLWKLGESFVKVSGREGDIYGKIYLQKKQQEIDKNERGEFVQQAADILKKKNIGKSTDAYAAYSQGKLPPAHIHARAKRFAVVIFLSHYHEVAYKLHYGKEPPVPYAIAHLGHAHKIEPPPMPV